MNISPLLFLLAIANIFTVEAAWEWTTNLCNFLTNICTMPLNGIKGAIDHFEKYGEGQEAKKQLAKSTELLEKQSEIMNIMAASQAKDDSKILQSLDKNTVAINAHAQITKEGFDALRTSSDLQRAAQIVLIAGTSIYIAKSANEFYHWAFPTEEELLRREKTSQDLAFLKNRRFLYQCLAENPKSVRNEEGIPVKCEDSFKAFVAVVGSIEAEKLKESFKKL